jgi:hypothetical protein
VCVRVHYEQTAGRPHLKGRSCMVRTGHAEASVSLALMPAAAAPDQDVFAMRPRLALAQK